MRMCMSCFQSPFHRGNGCYRDHTGYQRRSPALSVPFSSGQWLLPETPEDAHVHVLLSVPFSSGQWLLLGSRHADDGDNVSFQSPFHRGNGCYSASGSGNNVIASFQSPFHRGNGCYTTKAEAVGLIPGFQSPFHRGNGCYCRARFIRFCLVILSVPFSSGQWLLQLARKAAHKRESTFSPLFIGAMVATDEILGDDDPLNIFQSPFHRGNGCYEVFSRILGEHGLLSVPFSSGQWLLP